MGRGHIIRRYKAQAEARKRQRDAVRVEQGVALRIELRIEQGVGRAYDRVPPEGLAWAPWDGEYSKDFYWLRPTRDSALAVKCWPNAGIMNSVDGSGRMWKPDPNVLVALADDDFRLS